MMSMKKMVLFCLLLMTAAGMQAQSLDGKWKTLIKSEEYNQKPIELFFTFDKGKSSMSLKVDMSYHDDQVGTLYFSAMVPGAFSRTGDNLNVLLFTQKAELKLEKVDFTGQLEEAFKEQPELKQTVMKAMEETLENGKENFIGIFKNFKTLVIEKHTDTELWLKTEGDSEVLVFIRCAE